MDRRLQRAGAYALACLLAWVALTYVVPVDFRALRQSLGPLVARGILLGAKDVLPILVFSLACALVYWAAATKSSPLRWAAVALAGAFALLSLADLGILLAKASSTGFGSWFVGVVDYWQFAVGTLLLWTVVATWAEPHVTARISRNTRLFAVAVAVPWAIVLAVMPPGRDSLVDPTSVPVSIVHLPTVFPMLAVLAAIDPTGAGPSWSGVVVDLAWRFLLAYLIARTVLSWLTSRAAEVGTPVRDEAPVDSTVT